MSTVEITSELFQMLIEKDAQIAVVERMLNDEQYVTEKDLRTIFNIPKPTKEEGDK